MTFDFSNIQPTSEDQLPIDPIEIFRSLRVRDPAVNDLWLGQAEALQPWHEERSLNDIAIGLNTGAGKTLVGLLLAQSLVNETRGRVLYACNSIQLVEQTRDKALGYGMDVTTYIRGDYSNDLFSEGRSPCITTYQALFNGKSVFARSEVDAVIFDDAHTAEGVLRDQFTVTIKHSEFPEIYNNFVAEFRDYFHGAGYVSTFEDIVAGTSRNILIIPPFEVRAKFERILTILRSSGLDENQETLFSWEHLKDKLDICCYLLTSGSISISPPFIPVRTLPYFNGGVRRIYLSATLNAADAYARTFGKVPEKTISPKTSAGECERLILIPSLHEDNIDDVATSISLTRDRKALIMCPSYKRAESWESIAHPANPQDVSTAVNNFKSSGPPSKLLLTARYDGVDLPGETCRIMIIDDLPSSASVMERFMWEYLRMSKTLRSLVASRVVQSFGRISRGMSDYGVVILTGKALIDWLSNPKNQMAIPAYLQKQIQMGIQVSKQLPPSQMSDTIDQCLNRDENWINSHENFVESASTLSEPRDTETEAVLAKAEAKFASAMWRRDFSSAATCLTTTMESARSLSASTLAWHQYWVAVATDLAGDGLTARKLYRQAHGAQPILPAPEYEFERDETVIVGQQASQAALQFVEGASGNIDPPQRMDPGLEALRSGGSPAQVEEAIRFLGILLGFKSTRPDNEEGTGPDNLWILGTRAFCMDAKTDKEPDSVYRKEEIGQMADHMQWVRDNTDATEIIPIFVGPMLAASDSANPSNDLLVVSREELGAVVDSVLALFRDVASTAIPLNLESTLSERMTNAGLLMENLLQTVSAVQLVEIGEAIS